MRPTIPSSLRREMSALLGEMEWCAELAADPVRLAARAPAVSGWSVAEQLEHLLRVDRGILGRLGEAARGSAPEAAGGPSVTGRLVLVTGTIPRGRGSAPDGTRPEGV